MPTSLNKYLDRPALDETVVNIRQLTEALEEEMQNLPFAQPDGLYPDMTVGSVIGADETAQWSTRESTGSGTAIVRNAKGANEIQSDALVPVRIAGIASTTEQGGELDSIEWPTFTLRSAGGVVDELKSDELVTRVGVVDLGTLSWSYDTSVTNNFFRTVGPADMLGATTAGQLYIACAGFDVGVSTTKGAFGSNVRDMYMCQIYGQSYKLAVRDNAYNNAADFKAAVSGVLLFYALVTPTTTPISPALPMTYRVEQGGTESIIVPDGEISAAPVMTVAEPINAGDEFARIWAAIQSLGYTRNTAQLSRPVSLTDIGSIDEVQKDTAEIDTTKEVTE